MEKVTINGKEYAVKAGMKAIIVFETMAEKPFEIKNTTDVLTYVYSAILANNPETTLGFDEFLDAVDDNPELMTTLTDIVLKRSALSKVVAMSKDDGGTEPKKDH